MSTTIVSFTIPSNASKANPTVVQVPYNAILLGIFSATPNPVLVWSVDPTQQQTSSNKYYWVPLTPNPTLDTTQYVVGVASGTPSVQNMAVLIQDMS